MCRNDAVFHRRRVDGRTVVVLPCDGVAALGRVECRRICRFACHCDQHLIPSSERVCVLDGLGLGGVGMCRNDAVLHRRRVDGRAVVVLPRDGVAALGRIECRRVCGGAGDRDYIAPTRERVFILRRRSLRRRRAAVCGRLAVCDGRCGGGAITIDIRPRDGVAAQDGSESGLIRRFASDGDDIAPSRECIVILRRRCLRRCGVGRRVTVVHCGGVDNCASIVLPCNRVGAQNRVECRRVGGLALDRRNRWRPSRERVGVLRIGGLRRRFAGIGGHIVVLDLIRAKHRTILVLPCDGVFVYRRVVFGGVGRLARHRRDFGIPARERVGELRRRGLRRLLAAICRHLVVLDAFRIERRAVVVLPGDGVLVYRRVVRGGVRRLARHRRDFGIPARERVGVFRRRGLFRSVACGQIEFVDDLFLENRLAVVVKPSHGVLRNERAQTRIHTRRELPDCRIPAVERNAALHLGGREARHAGDIARLPAARLGIPIAAGAAPLCVARGGIESAGIGLARNRADRIAVGECHIRIPGPVACDEPACIIVAVRGGHGAERAAVGEVHGVAIADEAAHIRTAGDGAGRAAPAHCGAAAGSDQAAEDARALHSARRHALLENAVIGIPHQTADIIAGARDVTRRPAAAKRHAVANLTDKTARAGTPPRHLASDRCGRRAVFDDAAIPLSHQAACRVVVAAQHRAAFHVDVGYAGRIGILCQYALGAVAVRSDQRVHNTQVLDFRANQLAEHPLSVGARHVADFVVPAVVIAVVPVVGMALEVLDAGHVDVRSLHVEAGAVHRHELFV